MTKTVYYSREFVTIHETISRDQLDEHLFPDGKGQVKYWLVTGTGPPDGNPLYDYDYAELRVLKVQSVPPPAFDDIVFQTESGTERINRWDTLRVPDDWEPPPDVEWSIVTTFDGEGDPDVGYLGAFRIRTDGFWEGLASGGAYTGTTVKGFFRSIGEALTREVLDDVAGKLGVRAGAAALLDAIKHSVAAGKALYKIHDTALSTLTTLSKGTLDPKQMAALIDTTFWKAQRDANETLLDLMDGSTNKALRDMKSGPAKDLVKALTGTTFAVLNPYEYGNNDKDNVFYQSRSDTFHPTDIVGESSSGEGFVVGSIHNDVLHATTYGADVFAGAGNDTIYEPDSGGDGSYLAGGSGNDTYVVFGFSDPTIYDSSGTDTVIVTGLSFALTNSSKVENLRLQGGDDTWGYGNKLDNQVVGNRGDNHLKGLGGKDTLKGGVGSDTLAGGTKADKLTGSSGADRFVFDTRLGSGNVDTITDFKHDIDHIALDDAIFRAIGPALERAEFYAKAGATRAHDKSDRIVYDTKSGKLYYDDDGKGGHAAVHFATLSKHPTLDHGDFVIV